MREAGEKRRVTPSGRMAALHGAKRAVDGVVGLISQRAGHRQRRIGEPRVPARLLGLHPLAHPIAMGLPGGVRDVIGQATPSLTERKPPHVLALARPVPQGSEIDGDGAVFTGPAGRVAHGHPSVVRSRKLRRYNGGNAL